jgi:PAS domain S-box-containing protein
MLLRDSIHIPHHRGPATAIAFSALAGLALLVNGALVVLDLRRIAVTDEWVEHTHQVLHQLQAFLGSVQEAERVQRGYVVTGERSYRDSFEDARAAVDLHLQRLGALTNDDPEQQARIDAMRPVVAKRMDVLSRAVELRDGPNGFESARALIRSGWGNDLVARIEETVDAMASQEEGLLVDRSQAFERALRVALVAFLLGLGASVALVAAAFRAFRGRLRERTEAAAQLHQEKERFRTTLTSIADAVIVTDAAGRITMFNDAAGALTGWDEAALGRPLDEELPIVSEATGQPVESPVDRVLRDGRIAGPAGRALLVRREGVDVPIDETGAPVLDMDGRVAGVVLVIRDNRGRREVERELARRADLLLEQDRRKDEFLAVLSHELRNPLAAVRNALAVVARAAPGSEQARRAREIAERQSGYLTRMVDDLLDVSRIARGKIRIERARLDLAEVVRRSVEDVRATMAARRLALELRDPGGPIWVDGDAARLAQVTSNLLTNAAKFTEPGGDVTVALEARAGRAVLRVRDTGAGMDGELVERLFQPFVQAEDTLHRAAGGLGLGLAIARSIVELHHGSIRAASDGPGKGAEFVVELPLAAASEAVAPGAGPQERAGSAMRVLVIEDNEDSAESLKDILELHGHEVSVAHDGPAGLAQARAAEPDVVLCDVGIPGLDGYEVARRLRAAGSRARLVALTGYAGADDVARARQAGFDAHLAKPPDLDRLATLLAGARGADQQKSA